MSALYGAVGCLLRRYSRLWMISGMSRREPQPPEIAWAEAELGEPIREAEVTYRLEDRRTIRLLGERGDVHFLKIAPRLRPERERLDWLRDRLPVPEVRAFAEGVAADRLLTVGLPGEDLRGERHLAEPGRVVELLATALLQIHALEPHTCPFRGDAEGECVVVHGDACLPNFLVRGGRVSGYLDVGALRVASPTVDLAAAVWSLRHNLGDGWGGPFLERYGWNATDAATVESLVALPTNNCGSCGGRLPRSGERRPVKNVFPASDRTERHCYGASARRDATGSLSGPIRSPVTLMALLLRICLLSLCAVTRGAGPLAAAAPRAGTRREPGSSRRAQCR